MFWPVVVAKVIVVVGQMSEIMETSEVTSEVMRISEVILDSIVGSIPLLFNLLLGLIPLVSSLPLVLILFNSLVFNLHSIPLVLVLVFSLLLDLGSILV